MTQCRDLENRYHEKLLEISITTLEKSVKNQLDEDLPADVRMVRAPKKFISSKELARTGGHSLFSEGKGFPGGSIELKPCLNQSITSSQEAPATWLNCSATRHLCWLGQRITALQVSLGAARAGGSSPGEVLSKCLSCLQHNSLLWVIFRQPQPSRHLGSIFAALAAGFVQILPAPPGESEHCSDFLAPGLCLPQWFQKPFLELPSPQADLEAGHDISNGAFHWALSLAVIAKIPGAFQKAQRSLQCSSQQRCWPFCLRYSFIQWLNDSSFAFAVVLLCPDYPSPPITPGNRELTDTKQTPQPPRGSSLLYGLCRWLQLRTVAVHPFCLAAIHFHGEAIFICSTAALGCRRRVIMV